MADSKENYSGDLGSKMVNNTTDYFSALTSQPASSPFWP